MKRWKWKWWKNEKNEKWKNELIVLCITAVHVPRAHVIQDVFLISRSCCFVGFFSSNSLYIMYNNHIRPEVHYNRVYGWPTWGVGPEIQRWGRDKRKKFSAILDEVSRLLNLDLISKTVYESLYFPRAFDNVFVKPMSLKSSWRPP